ncbi:hypothetical protein ASD80_13775 [Devosia sp. Root635]|nr:hypothetical protein ASD80_13775 [Devosia sp. Root635]
MGAPAGAEGLSVALSGVSIEGGKPELAAATAELQAALTGRVSVADIFARARDLEAAYADAGYFLVRVVVPAQQLVDGGRLHLSVVDGFLERVDADDLPDPIRSRVLALVEPLLDRPGVTMREIERRLLLAGDIPGTGLKTALATGVQPGGTVLVVDAEFDAIVPFLGVDNTLPPSLGTWVVSGGVDFNGLLGAGESIYFRAAGHPSGNGPGDKFGLFDDDPRYRSLTAGAIMPIGLDGLTLNIEGTVTQTTPTPVGGLQLSSLFQRLSSELRYPFIRSREFSLNGALSFDIQNEYQNIITGVGDIALSEDRVRVFRASTDGIWNAPAGTVTGSATFSLGIDGLGARNAAGAGPVPLSRQGADASFAKLEASLGYAQTLSQHLAFSLDARAQTSFGVPLVRSEQIGIAGFADLSGFDAGALTGDSGWVVRAEMSAPFEMPVGDIGLAAAPYVFGAVGAVYLAQPTILESATITAQSIGVGLRLGGSIGDTSPTLTLEYARAFRSDAPASDRLTVVSSVRF